MTTEAAYNLATGALRPPWLRAGANWRGSLPPFAREAARTGLLLDFINNRYYRRRIFYSNPILIPGWSYTRSGSAYDLAGTTLFGASVPRRTSAGLLVEAGATNLFLNSDVGATQSITLTAVAHTLSFWGTGSVTLSGTATGTLNGTGVANRVSLTFTPTAGSVTFTVSGSITFVQVETGSSATSYIPTTSSSASRGADAVSVAFTQALPYSAIAIFNPYQQLNSPRVLGWDGSAQQIVGYSNTGISTFNGTGGVADSFGSPFNQVNRTAVANATGDAAISVNGRAVVTGAGNTAGGSTLWIGSQNGSGNVMSGLITLLAFFPRRITNTELQAATA